MGSEQVLVVDDESRILESIGFFLKREGFAVTLASNGREALAHYRQMRFDLVLLDISMPDMDGFEVMAGILVRDPEAMVIMVTGYATVESAVRALKQGAWDFLKKPFEYAELVATVKNGLAQKRLIDENRAVLSRLDISEKRYSYMVNNSPDLIYTLDSHGCFNFVNDEFEKVLGYTKEYLIGQRYAEIIHPDDLGRAEGMFNTKLPESEARSTLKLRLKKSKDRFDASDLYNGFVYVELKATGIYLTCENGHGENFSGTYGVARDVTERINLEDQLRQSQKMEALGTLAGGIAHDFNNILMGIQGYTSLVKRTLPPDSPEYKKLANVDEYVQNGSEMTRQLLGFAQKTDKKQHMININYILKMSSKMFGRTKKELSIRHNLQKDLWSAQGDEGQIKQVLLNLFVNAWQAMPAGGNIYIKTENVMISQSKIEELGLEKAGPYVKISVVDTGIGMDRETMDRIFDPFFTTKAMGGGTGIGLATAYGIVKSHGGTFRVLSKKGEGSSFSFYLPAQESKSVCCAVKAKSSETIIHGKGTVLLVDDEPGTIDVCSEMLKSLGYCVRSVKSGTEAVHILKTGEESFDLVIVDMIMPEMNGFETVAQIRTIKPGAKVLLSSGYSRQDDFETIREKGFDDFIQKPFDIAMLSEKINAVFDLRYR
ncbi:MAG: response regulator [Pseudomonadota bacterium]